MSRDNFFLLSCSTDVFNPLCMLMSITESPKPKPPVAGVGAAAGAPKPKPPEAVVVAVGAAAGAPKEKLPPPAWVTGVEVAPKESPENHCNG